MNKLQQIMRVINPPQTRRVNPYAIVRSSGVTRPVRIHQSVNKINKQVSNVRSGGLNVMDLHRLTSDWVGDGTDINSIIRGGIVRARNRSREESRYNPYCKKYIRMLEKNVVGPDGFTLRNKSGDFVLTDDPKNPGNKKYIFQFDKSANSKIYEGFVEWSKAQNCTMTRDIFFREECSLSLKTVAIDGEILVREIKGPEANNKFGYSHQLIMADYLDETFNVVLSNGNVVFMGVELNKWGEEVAYWLKKISPQSLLWGSLYGFERYRVAAKDPINGDVIHLFKKESPNQTRGIPWFVPSAIRLRMLSGYEEAVLVDARLTANRSVALERQQGVPTDDEIQQANIGSDGLAQTDSQGNEIMYQPSEPGEYWKVPAGYTAKPIDFKSPSGREGDFVKTSLRGIASGFDVSYIALANDYEGVNYTSSRTNLLEERDTWKDLHSWFREHFLNRFEPNWLEMSLLKQAINLPLAKFDKWNKAWFQARSWNWVSPKDEADAILKIVANNAGSLDEFLSEKGWTIEDLVDQLVYEHDLFDKAGLEWPSDRTTKAGAPAQQDTADATDAADAEDDATVPKNGKAKEHIEIN
jgi:lambda family phage portal protein